MAVPLSPPLVATLISPIGSVLAIAAAAIGSIVALAFVARCRRARTDGSRC